MVKMIAITLILAMVFVGAGVTVKSMPASELKEFIKWGLVVLAGILAAVAVLGFITVLF